MITASMVRMRRDSMGSDANLHLHASDDLLLWKAFHALHVSVPWFGLVMAAMRQQE